MTQDPDNWQHRAANMRCRTCMWYSAKFTEEARKKLHESNLPLSLVAAMIGRCRRHAPTMNGFPVVYDDDWCGDHKIDEEKIPPLSKIKIPDQHCTTTGTGPAGTVGHTTPGQFTFTAGETTQVGETHSFPHPPNCRCKWEEREEDLHDSLMDRPDKDMFPRDSDIFFKSDPLTAKPAKIVGYQGKAGDYHYLVRFPHTYAGGPDALIARTRVVYSLERNRVEIV